MATRNDGAAARVAEGVAALERGDMAAAKAAFARALVINPRDAAAHAYLGLIADREGDLDEAEKHFAAAVTADSESPAAHNNYGTILLKRGRADQAAAEFERSLKLNARQPSALMNLAQIHFAKAAPESLRQARELFTQAFNLAPDAEIARALVVVALRLNDKTAAAAS
ncbi:MAG TPA: tetratricopeptide repeat protein, partial [Blastocatellia bacterium]